jgi:hypothetical protein
MTRARTRTDDMLGLAVEDLTTALAAVASGSSGPSCGPSPSPSTAPNSRSTSSLPRMRRRLAWKR